jgi:hypothetical protein
MEAVRSSETSVKVYQTIRLTSQNILLVLLNAVSKIFGLDCSIESYSILMEYDAV